MAFINQHLPPPEVPKRRLPWFLALLMAFAVLIVVGLVVSFVRTADVPRPALDAPIADSPTPQR